MIQPFLQPQQPPERTILTVSQLNLRVKGLLENNLGSLWLSGEISNFTRAVSGHWYFSLKDDQAQIRCAMFRFKTQNLSFAPKEGDQVVIKGKVSLYEARGDYQFIADYMEPAGLGDLQQKLNELMIALRAEGLFSEEHKQSLPRFPRQIGVITSPTGAAIHDVLTVLQRRCPMVPVVIYPTQVQGAAASQSIIDAIDIAEQRAECDVLLLTRGGGSLEDLWCFNDEQLARRIYRCTIPTIAAVGHEVDITIAELVADLRAATPSAAAELMVPDQQSLRQTVDRLSLRLQQALNDKLQQLQNRLNIARLKLADPENAIIASQLRLHNLERRLHRAMQENRIALNNKLVAIDKRLHQCNPIVALKDRQRLVIDLKYRLLTAWQKKFEKLNQNLKVAAGSLDALSPLSTLSRGYSIVRDPETKKIINQTSQLKKSQIISLLLSDGEADCKVESVHKTR